MPKNHVVITGGGGSGKSSLIEYFIAQGYCAVREAAREQIRLSFEQNSDALPWADIIAFSKNVQQQMVEDYELLPEATFCFYDRCLLDVLSYILKDDISAYDSLLLDIEKHRYYPTVFVLPPWQEIFTKDNERTEDFEDTIVAFDVIKHTYESNGYEIVELPKVSVEGRAAFILNHLKEHGIE
jgi:predicted ATPase